MRSRDLLQEKLAAGKSVGGLIQFVGHPVLNELMAVGGADFVIIDMEHSVLDLENAGRLIFTSDAVGVAPFVRVPEVDPSLIGKLLELGAAGIVLPHASRSSCAALLQAVRYAPEGTRGACPMVRAKGYARGGWDAYAQRENREVMAIPMIEEKADVDDFEALAGMPGLGPFFIGATDLSISLGVAEAGWENPQMAAALDRMIGIAKRHGKRVMCGIGKKLDVEAGRAVARRGASFLVYGTDSDLYTDALRRIAAVKTIL